MKHYIVYTKDILLQECDLAVFESEYEAQLYCALYNDKKDWKSNAAFVKDITTDPLLKVEPFTISWRYPIWKASGRKKWHVESPQATLSTIPRSFIGREDRETQIVEGYVVMDRSNYTDEEVLEAFYDYLMMEDCK